MATFRGDEGWLGGWTVFFWGWFLGYGPMMAIFIARISRGRTIRQKPPMHKRLRQGIKSALL